MSTQQTRKEITEDRDRLSAENAELQAKVAEIEAAQTAAIEAKDVQIANLTEMVEAKDAELTIVATTLDEVNANLETIKADIESKDNEIALLKATLNPAAKDIEKVEASLKEVVQIEDAEADEAEKIALGAVENPAPKNELETWESMEPGQARTEYWNKHKGAMMSQMSKRAAEENQK